MDQPCRSCHRLLVPALALLLASALAAQEGVPRPPGLVTEQMWWPPTAEDWKKPVLIQWQRTWSDAVTLSQQTKRPILICVNMDGEPASEHYAGVRYRQADITKLYEPYVCVIASVYRHNPRDYDEHGNRILCPRLGCVTCGEHIAIEPLLYEKYFDGKRVSPRHIMVELDGKETYDVFYTWDTDSVFKAVGDGIKNRNGPQPIVRGDRSLLEKVDSPDSIDRDFVEKAFIQGDAAARRSLLSAAEALGAEAPVELLRLAAAGFDAELAQRARASMAKSTKEGAVDLIGDTLKQSIAARERAELVANLERLGAGSAKAKMLATAHRGLDGKKSAIDVAAWSQAGQTYQAPAAAELQRSYEAAGAAADAAPKSAEARLTNAQASLEMALAGGDPSTPLTMRRRFDKMQQLQIEDALREVQEAAKLGVQDWRSAAVEALCRFHKREYATAYKLAETAVATMPPTAPGAIGAGVMAIFAEARQMQISDAVKEKKEWSPVWMSDVHAAYSVLLRHPLGTAQHVAWHWDFLQFFGAAQTGDVLEAGLERFPDSNLLHERLRKGILATSNVDGLEKAYEQRLQSKPSANMAWFAGYASMVAAEAHRRAGAGDKAIAAYDRAIARFEQSCADKPENKPNADHYAAMALGGKARIRLQQGQLEPALELLEAALSRYPQAAATPDGLNLTTVDTARALRAKASQPFQEPLVKRVDEALAKLDPKLLEAPEYERELPAGRGRRRGGK